MIKNLKFVMIAFMITFFGIMNANAQEQKHVTAIETPTVFDNWHLGVTAGASIPLNFEGIMPVNTLAGLRLSKELTPVIGAEAEYIVSLGDNGIPKDLKTAVKAHTLFANMFINVNNLFNGYKGKPQPFEVRTNTGIGWLHTFTTENKSNALGVKTGLDFLFNIGNKRALTFMVSPSVYWNVTDGKAQFKMNSQKAQLTVLASLVWNFKNSNGTRYWKQYDITAMLDEINRKPEVVYNDRVVEKVIEKNTATVNPICVQFAQNSPVLETSQKDVLDKLPNDKTYNVAAYASPEGTEKLNNELSQKRADAIAEYLNSKGIKTNIVKGYGVALGNITNRIAIVSPVED